MPLAVGIDDGLRPHRDEAAPKQLAGFPPELPEDFNPSPVSFRHLPGREISLSRQQFASF